MNDLTETGFGYTDGDVDTNTSTAVSLNELAERRLSRRQTLRGGSAIVAATLGGSVLAACDSTEQNDSDNNTPPTVNAGAAISTSAGRLVTLNGDATDDKGVEALSWTQTAGPTVSLTNPTSKNPTFIAPAVSAATTFTFQLAAADAQGRSATGIATVTVNPATLGFTAVPKSLADVVSIPEGYTLQVINRLGDPIAANVPAYKNDGTDTNFAQRIGDHHDALQWFGLNSSGTRDPNSSTRGLMVQNHENITQKYLHANGATTGANRLESEAIKEIEAHGVSITELTEGANRAWTMVQASSFNRRITPNTPMALYGPARGSDLLKTAYSPDGTSGRGTINNCANGITAWGTLLTCEENWAGYFRRTGDVTRSAKETASFARYGISATANGSYGWATVVASDPTDTRFRRWDIRATGSSATTDFRNEANQYGWVVEIDPYNPNSTPRKRTALGRFGHEGAWPGKFAAGRKPAWYMGDDSGIEHLYKFVSATAWAEADANATDRLAMGDKYLDRGTLYVARFNADGTGIWLPLVYGQNGIDSSNAAYPFADQADVLVNTRLAASVVGATPMDRPEWTAVNPVTGEVYLTLTNNSGRTAAAVDAANPRSYSDPKITGGASNGNANGHIIRLREDGDTTEATAFKWDIYLFGAGSDLDPANINVSGLTADQDFSSPDGMAFARSTSVAGQVKPLLWFQTDDGAYTDVTNCMMLAALPGSVGDGGARTITSGTRTQATRVGAAPTAATLKRFLVGPKDCEITGLDTTPDGRTLFVGIQHPGDGGTVAAPSGHWPYSQATGTADASVRPRSATVVITKNDGGVIGL
ncbi:PhoX family phosphatase [Sphingomonas sp. IC-56]|uniref:PhoX family protein n=1 Tax=Sphingomonas sp. IC-56 TaxID=2898529 RepID=UPI001E41650E|nr:alkaline phosphatase PhoX [Sphingomonas sp. IC-56]MCD2325102.1 PhoX family phosphatase [Sphingomonas sp. IC-56]